MINDKNSLQKVLTPFLSKDNHKVSEINELKVIAYYNVLYKGNDEKIRNLHRYFNEIINTLDDTKLKTLGENFEAYAVEKSFMSLTDDWEHHTKIFTDKVSSPTSPFNEEEHTGKNANTNNSKIIKAQYQYKKGVNDLKKTLLPLAEGWIVLKALKKPLPKTKTHTSEMLKENINEVIKFLKDMHQALLQAPQTLKEQGVKKAKQKRYAMLYHFVAYHLRADFHNLEIFLNTTPKP